MNSAFFVYEELGRSWKVLSTSADNRHNTLLDLPNFSFPTQPHSLIPNYIIHWLIFARFYSFSVTWCQIAGRVLAPAEHHGLNLPIPQNLVITRPYTASDCPSAPQEYQCLFSHYLATWEPMLRENWLHINVAINWQLSKQGIRWPVSPDRLRCLPIQVEYFLKLSADYFWSDLRLKYIFLKIHMKYILFMSLWPRTIKMLISNWHRTRKFSQSSFYATDWSKFDRWVHAEIYTASWNLFT